MMTQAQYEQHKRAGHMAALKAIDNAPLADRRAARLDWQDAMRRYPSVVGERVAWLLNGSYGCGAMLYAQEAANAKRGNKAATLGQMIAALEWRCPSAFAREAWKNLTPAEQAAVDAAIMRAVTGYQKETAEEKAKA